jgi:hypothetical protein
MQGAAADDCCSAWCVWAWRSALCAAATRGFDEVCRVSTNDSKVVVHVMPADEDRMMAHEVLSP